MIADFPASVENGYDRYDYFIPRTRNHDWFYGSVFSGTEMNAIYKILDGFKMTSFNEKIFNNGLIMQKEGEKSKRYEIDFDDLIITEVNYGRK